MSKRAWVGASLCLLATGSGAAVVACGAGANGVSGSTTLVSTTAEPAGANCANGGTRVDVGEDTNNDGVLQSSEIKQTRYVCNGTNGTNGTSGKDGTSYLITTAAEPPGSNCAQGGTKIESGADTNGNGILDGTEATTTYVCNGNGVVGDGGNLAVTVYGDANGDAGAVTTSSPGVTTTALQASLDVPASGSIVAIASVDAFCASPALSAGYDCAASGVTAGEVTISNNAADAGTEGDYDYVYLTPNASESITRTAVFPVSSGTSTFYLRGEAQTGQIGFFRSQITLVFIPHS